MTVLVCDEDDDAASSSGAQCDARCTVSGNDSQQSNFEFKAEFNANVRVLGTDIHALFYNPLLLRTS